MKLHEKLSFSTALAVGDEFFEKQHHLTDRQLLPVISELISEVDGLIDEIGIYKFTLEVSRLK